MFDEDMNNTGAAMDDNATPATEEGMTNEESHEGGEEAGESAGM